MPTNKKLVTKTLNYMKIALALIIMVPLLCIILTEQEFLKEQILNKNHFNSIISKAKYCEEVKTYKYLEVMFKCFLAFFSGCLLSEIKFLKTGVI